MIIFICIACAILILLSIVLLIILFAKFRFRVFINNKDIKIYWKRKVIYNSLEEYEDDDDSDDI